MAKKLLTLFGAFASILTFIFTGCTVGLGEAVDTQPPKLEIEEPNDGLVIMNSFTMAGSCSDETNLKSVEVSVISTTDSDVKYGPYTATINEKSTAWSIVLNEKKENSTKFEIPDGEYTFKVTATDSAGRTTDKSKVYKIDNTAPVVVLKRPDTSDSYGRTIKITGDIGDSSSLSALYFTAFEKDGENYKKLGNTIKKSNISGVGLELVVGKYFCEPDSDAYSKLSAENKLLNDIYFSYYGNETTGSKDILCMIEVCDAAVEYKTPVSSYKKPALGDYAEAAEGNLSECYYIYDAIYNELYSSAGFGLSNSDLVKIENGTFSNAETIASVSQFLKTKAICTTEEIDYTKISSCSLNPNNYPSYMVSGYAYEGTFSEIQSSGKIMVSVYQGRDQIKLNSDSLRLVLDECDKFGNLLYPDSDAKPENRKQHEKVLIYSKSEIDAMEDGELKATRELIRANAITKGESVQIATSIGALPPKSYYAVRVDGEDLEGNPVEPSDGNVYGFKVATNGKPPVVYIQGGIDDLDTQNKAAFTWNGYVETQSEGVNLYYKLSAKNEKKSTESRTTEFIPVTFLSATQIEAENFDWNEEGLFQNIWKINLSQAEVKALLFKDEELPSDALWMYTVTLYATDKDDEDNKSSEVLRRVHVDTASPSIGNVNISPYASVSDEITTVNGTISISTTVTDNYTLSGTEYEIYWMDGESKVLIQGGRLTDMSISIDKLDTTKTTTDTGSKKWPSNPAADVFVSLIAEDLAGNRSAPVIKKIHVDQSTDMPVVLSSNASTSITVDTIASNQNLFNTTNNNKLALSISDDDGIESVNVSLYKYDTSLAEPAFVPVEGKQNVSQKITKGSTSATISYILPGNEGKFKVEVSVFDILYESASENTKAYHRNDASAAFYVVGVDAGAPILKLNIADGQFMAANKAFEISGSVQDSCGAVTLYRYATKEAAQLRELNDPSATNGEVAPQLITGTDSSDGKGWSETLSAATVGTAGKTIYYVAVDSYKQATLLSFVYKIDNAVPTVAPGWSSGSGNSVWSNQSAYEFSIPLSDAWNCTEKVPYITDNVAQYSDISTVTLTVDGTKSYTMSLGDGYSNDEDSNPDYAAYKKYYYWYRTTVVFDSGEHTVTISAKDKSGNVTGNLVSYSYKVDASAPEVTASAFSDSLITKEIQEEIEAGTRTVTMTATITDAESGINIIQLKDGADILYTADWTSGTLSETLVPVAESSKKKVTAAFTGTDKNRSCTFTFDASVFTTKTHSFEIITEDKATNRGVKTENVKVDVTAPTITLNGYSPYITKTENDVEVKYVNGIIKITGSIEDETQLKSGDGSETAAANDNFTALHWDLVNGSGTVVLSKDISLDGGTYQPLNFEVNTTDSHITDNKTYTLKITVRDAVGNEAYDSSIVLKINQSTNLPEITPTNYDSSIKTAANVTSAVQAGKAGNILSTGTAVTATITDDDGIKTVKVSYKAENAASYGTAYTALSDGKATSYSLKYDKLPKTEGLYFVKIEVEDIYGTVSNSSATSEFVIVLDDGAPEFKDVTPTTSEWHNKTVSVGGTVKDGSGQISIVASGSGTSANFATKKTTSAATASLTDTVTISSLADSTNEYTITYTAYDRWGRSETKDVRFKKDGTVPAFKLSSTNLGSKAIYDSSNNVISDVWFKSDALTITGTLTEAHSGVQTIYYWVQKPGASKPDVSDLENADGSFGATNGSGEATFKASIDGFNEGANTLYLVAEDKAGNITPKANAFSYIANVDMTPAELEMTTESPIRSNGLAGKTISLAGTYTETGSGVASVSIKVDNTDASSVSFNDGKWTATIGTDAGNITGTITDNAGNTNKISLGKVVVDKTPPVITLSESILNKISSINGENALSGSAVESNPESLTIYYSKTGTVADPTGNKNGWTSFFTTTDASTIYNWTTSKIDFDTLSGAISGTGISKLYILPVAYDKAGNCNIHLKTGTDQQTANFTASSNFSNVMKQFTVDMNGDRPILKMSELTGASGSVRKYVTGINGVINDDDGIAEFYVCDGNIYSVVSGNLTATPLDFSASKAAASWANYIENFKNKSADEKAAILTYTSNGSFSYVPEDGSDGIKNLYFYIKDTSGHIFYTGNTATPAGIYRPYILYKNGAANVSNDTVITYQTDSNPPSINDKGYIAKADADSVAAASIETYKTDIGSSITIGGAQSAFVRFMVEASDSSGIKSVTSKIADSKGNTKKEIIFAKDDGSGKYLCDSINFAEIKAEKFVFESGTYTMSFTVIDNSDLPSTQTIELVINNDKPEISGLTPDSNAVQTGVITIGGRTSSILSKVTTVKYLLVKDKFAGYSDSQLIAEFNKSTNKNNFESAMQFQFVFDGSSNPMFPTEDSLDEFAGCTDDGQYYNIPVYFYAEDELGNYEIKKDYTIRYNPYSDRPTTTITYPSDGQILSGTINLVGTAVDDNGGGTPGSITGTYIQIDYDNDDDYDADDVALLIAKGYTICTSSANKDVYTGATVIDGNFAADTDFWGMPTDSEPSLVKALNATGQLQKVGTNSYTKTDAGYVKDASSETSTTGRVYKFKIRAAALDDGNLLGNWSKPVEITIDPNAPNFGVSKKAYVAQFSGSTETAQKAYSTSLCLKDEWYLLVSVEHNSGIQSLSYLVTVRDSDGESYSNSSSGTIVENGTVKDSAKISSTLTDKGYIVKIPLGTSSGSGVKKLKLTAVAKGGVSSEVIYDYTFDNVAPEISHITYNTDYEFKEGSILKNSDANVVTVGSKVTDGTAGVDRMMFYFYRETDKNSKKYTRVFDPMRDKDNDKGVLSNLAGIDVLVDGAASTTGVTSEEVVSGYNMYGLSQSVGRPSTTTLTFSGSNVHIRAGGVVKLAGGWHRIKSVSTSASVTTVTLADDDEIATSFTAAFFPYVQVVDNTGSERVKSYTSEPFTFSNNSDDGDLMPESITGVSALERTWNATFHGHFIPDGPVTLVIFAFDKSENVAATKVSGHIQNNRPRLAKVHLGTDLNGDGKWTADEYETYNMYSVEGTSQEVYELKTLNYDESANIKKTRKSFTIKDKLAVAPEFVNGNGNIGLVFSNDDSGTTKSGEEEYIKKGTKGKADGVRKDLAYRWIEPETDVAGGKVPDFGANGYNFTTNIYNFVITKDYLAENGKGTAYGDTATGAVRAMNFTFWDSTEGQTQGVDSQYCFLRVKDFIVDQVDEVAPTAVVDPFYWNSLTSNSIYGSSTAETFENLKGHIELEADWTKEDSNGYVTPGYKNYKADTEGFTTTEFDEDPKVSGKIVFTGYVYDDVRLGSIKATFGNILNNTTLSTYTSGTGWSNNTATMADNHYEFAVSTAESDGAYLNQNGHKVKWTLSVDTAALTGIVQRDIPLSITATDAKSGTANTNSTTASTTDTSDGKYNVPSYQVDVVPYVLKVETKLSKQKKTNWSIYNRSALGHYPVQSVIQKADDTKSGTKQRTKTSEEVTLHGFNLNGTTIVINSNIGTAHAEDTDDTKKVTVTAQTASNLSQIKFNVAKLDSGKLNPTVNGIAVINNYNNNDAKGSAETAGTSNKNMYNMQGNRDTNNILNDDLIFDVWEFNDRAAVPVNGTATGVQMQVNQSSKMLNFAFANGGVFYSMGDGTYSSQYWAADYDTYAGPCVGLHVDDFGYSYSVASGGDTNTKGSIDKYVMYSGRWGNLSKDYYGTLNGNESLRLEEIALRLGSDNMNYSLMKYRYLSSEMASSTKLVSQTKTTNLYFVNYDVLTDEIRFRAGTFNKEEKQTSDGFQDEYTSATCQYYKTENCQVIANNSTSGGSFYKDNNGNKTTVAAITNRGAGMYVDVGVATNGTDSKDSKDVACVVWYDAYDNCLKYTYYVDPISNWNSLKGNRTASGWSTPVTIFAEGGEYCQIAVDVNNHIHIAAYAGNGDVKYAYLDAYNSSYSESTNSCTVDASGAVGEHLTLDVAVDSSGNSIPYIGYFTSAIKAPKYAYLVDTTDTNHVPAGVDSDERFTGAWEVTVVPTPSRLTTNREDKINIGVFKNEGVLNWSTTDGKAPASNGTNIGTNEASSTSSGYSSTETSKAYGNGSKNAVFAYQISGGTGSCVETAQMR